MIIAQNNSLFLVDLVDFADHLIVKTPILQADANLFKSLKTDFIMFSIAIYLSIRHVRSFG